MNHFKKSNNKLEKLRGIFFQCGLIIAGGITLLAFEWKTSYKIDTDFTPPDVVVEGIDELPPITYSPEPDKPKVKITQPKVNPDLIVIVPDIVSNPTPDPTPDPNPTPVFVPDTYEPVGDPEPPTIFTIVEKMPEFVGGDKARIKYLRDNLKYPKFDREMGNEGTVYMKFVISKKGEIKNVEILRGVNERLDKEAIRVVKAMPNWSPGKQRGKAVDVSYSFRVTFALK